MKLSKIIQHLFSSEKIRAALFSTMLLLLLTADVHSFFFLFGEKFPVDVYLYVFVLGFIISLFHAYITMRLINYLFEE